MITLKYRTGAFIFMPMNFSTKKTPSNESAFFALNKYQ